MSGPEDTEDTDATGDTENTENAGETEEDGGGLASLARCLLETVVDVEASAGGRAVGSGSTDVGRGRIDHDFSIGISTIEEITDDDRRRIGPSDATDVGAGIDAGSDSGETTGSIDADHPTHVRYDEAGTEAIVAVDVPEIDPEELSAGVSSRNEDLLVGTEERIAERVPHDLTNPTIAAASYHNAVLEVHLKEGGDRS